jgi:Uma2 family endonuclease
MTMQAEKPRRYSIEEYLKIADDSEIKLEYVNGEIISMAGGTYNHSLIIANFARELGNRLKGKPCRVLESNLRVGIPRKLRYMYPDIPVICGKPEFDPRDKKQLTVFNPRVIVEVLSPETERSDRGDKFTRYRELESLQEYVLVSQRRAEVETFYRRSDGTWLFSPFSGTEASVQLRALETELPMAEIYEGVEFPPEEQDTLQNENRVSGSP